MPVSEVPLEDGDAHAVAHDHLIGSLHVDEGEVHIRLNAEKLDEIGELGDDSVGDELIDVVSIRQSITSARKLSQATTCGEPLL